MRLQERLGFVAMALAGFFSWATGSDRLDFYRSDDADLFAVTTRFAPVGSWRFSANGFGAGSIDNRWGVYENINLFADDDGLLWLVGMQTTVLGTNISIDFPNLGIGFLDSALDLLKQIGQIFVSLRLLPMKSLSRSERRSAFIATEKALASGMAPGFA